MIHPNNDRAFLIVGIKFSFPCHYGDSPNCPRRKGGELGLDKTSSLAQIFESSPPGLKFEYNPS
jgi:hypothetical protein